MEVDSVKLKFHLVYYKKYNKMIELIAQIFGMTFIGIIALCMLWTIGKSIASMFESNNELEENLKNFDKKIRKWEK